MEDRETVGPHVLLERLGTGRHGPVHRARDGRRAGRIVTVKVLPGALQPDAVAAFRGIARRVAALDHPVPLPTLEVLTPDDEAVAIVRPHVAGGSVADLVADRGLSPAQVVAIGAAVADGLAALHDAGLAHGALTAGDLLLDAGDVPRLADVGLATLVGDQPASAREDVQTLARILRGAVAPDVALPADAAQVLDRAAAGLLSAAELRDALAPIDLREPAPLPRHPDGRGPPVAAHARRPRWATPVLLLGIALTGVVGLRAWGPPSTDPVTPKTATPSTTSAVVDVYAHPARTAPPPCDRGVRPSAPAGGKVVVVDVDARGCGVPLVLTEGADGMVVLTVPDQAGELAGRYAVAEAGERVLFGDWDCDGAETPAVHRPADGQVFLYDAYGRVTARPADVTVAPGQPVTVVTDGTCDRITAPPPAPATPTR